MLEYEQFNGNLALAGPFKNCPSSELFPGRKWELPQDLLSPRETIRSLSFEAVLTSAVICGHLW